MTNPIVYLLFSSKKTEDRQLNVLKTWGKGKDLFFYAEYSNKKNNVLKVIEPEYSEYQYLSKKQKALIDNLDKLLDQSYEWYFLGDDDTFVNTRLLERELESLDKQYVYGVNYSFCFGHAVNYPSGGGGCLISRDNMLTLSNNFSAGPWESPYEVKGEYADVNLGFNMKVKNILMKDDRRFFGEHPSHYNKPLDDAFNAFTFHRIKTLDEMEYMNNICNIL